MNHANLLILLGLGFLLLHSGSTAQVSAATPVNPIIASADSERIGPLKLRDVGIDQIAEPAHLWTEQHGT